MAAIDQIRVSGVAVDEHAARRTLRDQIARLERELGNAGPGGQVPLWVFAQGAKPTGVKPPRLLSLGELEQVRDALAARLGDARKAAAAQSARQADAARELERMLADPPAHKWRRITHADLGMPGCGDYHVRPKAGLLGMLMGWWQVKMSSGCP